MMHLRDKKLAQKILSQIKHHQVHLRFMHVCGTHQDTLMKHGLDSLLQQVGIEIRQGPGCPVCVTTPHEIEEAIHLAHQGKIIASFGDMIRVPGSRQSLLQAKTDGCDVRTVYSIEDAVAVAKEHPSKEVIFMAVGFETTAPTTALTLQQQSIPENFSILCCHRVIPPALKAILDMGEIKIDGFIQPGHVSTIIGVHPYEFISNMYHLPQVIAGFEPLDVLMAVWMLVQQTISHTVHVENEYTRAVHSIGNTKAQQAMKTVFTSKDVKWRGFPVIPDSGLLLRSSFEQYDARKRFADRLSDVAESHEDPACRCGDVLRGLITSDECPLFGGRCTPETPIGPCMVSSEGSCNIELRYGKKNR